MTHRAPPADSHSAGSGQPRRVSNTITFAGNIGSGKTAAATHLAGKLDAEVHLERVDGNPYLEPYYKDTRSWALKLNMYFLGHRAQAVVESAKTSALHVHDRSYYEDRLFVEQAHQSGATNTDDYDLFCKIDSVMTELLPKPRLLIYLHAPVPVLLARVRSRGRPFESDLSEELLQGLQRHYTEWINDYSHSPVISIDSSQVDLRDPDQLTEFVSNAGLDQ